MLRDSDSDLEITHRGPSSTRYLRDSLDSLDSLDGLDSIWFNYLLDGERWIDAQPLKCRASTLRKGKNANCK